METGGSLVVRLIEAQTDMLIYQMRLHKRDLRPSIRYHISPYTRECDICGVTCSDSNRLVFWNGSGQTSLVIILCQHCYDSYVRDAVVKAEHRVHVAYLHHFATTPMKRDPNCASVECCRCSSQRIEWCVLFPRIIACHKCAVLIKWDQYRMAFIVTRSIGVSDVYLKIELIIVSTIVV